MLLLVAAAMIAQPNVRVLDGVMTDFFNSVTGANEEDVPVQAIVDNLTVERRSVRGRVRNPSTMTMREVVIRVRLVPPGGGEGRTTSATVYSVAPGAEAWFGIPLVGGPPIASAELVDVTATAEATPASSAPTRSHLPAPSRRSGVGGMQDVQQQERDMQQMQEAARSVTGGQ